MSENIENCACVSEINSAIHGRPVTKPKTKTKTKATPTTKIKPPVIHFQVERAKDWRLIVHPKGMPPTYFKSVRKLNNLLQFLDELDVHLSEKDLTPFNISGQVSDLCERTIRYVLYVGDTERALESSSAMPTFIPLDVFYYLGRARTLIEQITQRVNLSQCHSCAMKQAQFTRKLKFHSKQSGNKNQAIQFEYQLQNWNYSVETIISHIRKDLVSNDFTETQFCLEFGEKFLAPVPQDLWQALLRRQAEHLIKFPRSPLCKVDRNKLNRLANQ
jgi:hypothetical protein